MATTRRSTKQAETAVRLSDCIAPAFYPVHWDIAAHKHVYYDLYGGRGSAKSSFVAIEIVLDIMSDKNSNAICFRKVAGTLKTSVYNQIIWAIEKLGVSHLWRCPKTTYECTYIPTGQVILFRGLDYPEKIKSIKVVTGYLKLLWWEELDSFSGPDEIRNVEQSVVRGGSGHIVFKTFNPPISNSNWANEYVLEPNEKALRHKSCYLDVPPSWLGDEFLDAAERQRQVNERAYQHEYLGIPVGTGGEVFENLEIREITDEEIQTFDNCLMGLDFGWYPDPAAWVHVNYNARKSELHIFDELRVYKASNAELWRMLQKDKGVTSNDLIIADSAEPKSIGDLRAYGALCRGAIKGPESRSYSYKWLQSLKKIIIDPVRCPGAAEEFPKYEYERTPQGEIISGYPDGNDHCIDATRYSCNNIWKKKGQ